MVESASKYHAVIIPDDPEKGGPAALSGNDLDGFLADVNKRLREIKRGWCHIILDGVKCELSEPRVVFKLKMPDGTLRQFGDTTAPSFSPDGSFSVPDQ